MPRPAADTPPVRPGRIAERTPEPSEFGRAGNGAGWGTTYVSMQTSLFVGYVPGEFMELALVFVTVFFTLGVMVLFGAWWSR